MGLVLLDLKKDKSLECKGLIFRAHTNVFISSRRSLRGKVAKDAKNVNGCGMI